MAITTINENDYIKDSRTVINDNFTELDTTKAPLNSPALTGTPTAPTPNPGDDSTKLATTEYVQEEIRTHANLPVGFEYFSPNPNIPQGSLPLFGGEYSRATYADLWAWVQEQTGYLKTEADWQDLSTAQNGNVPYYSDGDGSTTFRVPSLKCWIKAANGTVTEVGSYKAAGLPNITGALTPNDTTSSSVDIDFTGTGAVRATNATRPSGTTGTSNWTTWAGFNIDASRSSSVYGNASTVQPESIVGMWLVKAYGTIVDTGQIDEQQYIDDRIAALPTSLASTFLPLAGGEMSGDVKTIPAIMSTDWSTVYQSATALTTRWGVKGTLPVDRNICLTMAVSRDDSNKSTADETCRYGLLETGVFRDGASYVLLRGYKNAANSQDFAQILVGYDSSQNAFARVNGKNIETINASGSNYIRYESGLQLCWGYVSINVSTATGATPFAYRGMVVVTFPVSFKETPFGVSDVDDGSPWWTTTARGITATTMQVEASGNTSATKGVYWLAVGNWK